MEKVREKRGLSPNKPAYFLGKASINKDCELGFK